MQENNKTLRIRTKIGVSQDAEIQDKYLTVKLKDKIDTIEIMSLKIKQENAYKFHSSDYGVVVGRAIANGGFGVPNVKVSVFIAASDATVNDPIYNAIYPYQRSTQKNKDNIRYNLLPDQGNDDCYQVVGTFPNKRLVLDDDNYLEIYDTYYKFTTRTNNAGDYMIFGIPTGGQILHFDTDLSDVGVLSQKPRDMIYKGYNINQFENANQFKVDDNLDNLPQIISQDSSVYIYPFWGDEDENIIGITRHDIDINYKFEPTCVFIGSLVTDTNSNHISKKCIPTVQMGMMEELVTGSGTIEMIRKKQNGDVEQFNIQGTQLINDNGVWCYQIPMNLDYCMTDEYGNLVPSDEPTKGIATRASVRFRFSMNDFENDTLNSFRTKVLVPNNPQNSSYRPDYVFGSFTEDESFRDLLWNNVYTVKSFIPRFQKGNGNRNRRFSGIKQCNYYGQNNPIPYNNMRINLSFQFIITCLLVRLLVWLVGVYNAFITGFVNALCWFVNLKAVKWITKQMNRFDSWMTKGNRLIRSIKAAFRIIIEPFIVIFDIIKMISNFFTKIAKSLSCIYLDGSMCEALEGTWFFAPNCSTKKTAKKDPNNYIWKNMMGRIEGKKMSEFDFSGAKTRSGGGMVDKQSIDSQNADDMNDEESMVTIYTPEDTAGTSYSYVISRGINYFLQCIEISLAQEFRVVQFDFYNDWINGMIYIPRWERNLKRKRKYFLFGKTRVEVRACNDTYTKRFFERKNNLTEQCGVSYKAKNSDNSIGTKVGCKSNKKYKCHKKKGRRQYKIFRDGGVVHSELTASGLYAYYFRPCEYITDRNSSKNKKVNLFATDIVLLGSLTDCDLNGTPAFTNELTPTTYQLPSPLAHTDSTEEGFTYRGESNDDNIMRDEQFSGVFDISETMLNPQDDGSVTEESGIDWGYTGPGQGEPKKQKTYTPGGHFLGISCVSAESSIKSCVNLKRICEVNVWPSQRQEVFNGYDGNRSPSYVDIIPNGLIARDDIAEGRFRKLFATMNKNNLRTRINESGFTVYDMEFMSPENFGGELSKYSKGNYNEPNPIENIEGYLAKNGDVNDDGEVWDDTISEGESLSLKPIRRSLDDRDSDYMRFRLGLEEDKNGEIQKKFLGKDDYGFYMPVFENSYYFYFGLKPGSTALDEFHKQFFAECKHTVTTTDLRLKMKLSYHELGIEDAFSEPVVISIFDREATFRPGSPYNDSLKIYSTAVPIKIIIDGDPEKTYTISDPSDADKVYTEFDSGDFTFGIGRHTVTVMDSDGRSATGLVEVNQQKINFCPSITPAAFIDDNYIVNSTRSLVTGQGLRSGMTRDSLQGWFTFDFNTENCPECAGTTNPLFSYEATVGDPDSVTCVGIDQCTLLFVGKSHIIEYNHWNGTSIYDNEEFAGFDTGNTFPGTRGGVGFSIYAGEEVTYSLYVMYKNGTKETIPILIDDNLYIGEPDAIDFDIFREVIESEDDSPVTFRNPLIKIWYEYNTNWYKHLYDGELKPEQIWYVRKNMFFVMSGTTSTEDFNEFYPSARVLYINLYYPSTIGNVNSYTGGTITTQMNITGACETQIHVTGQTENGLIVRTPQSGTVLFKVFYKPYYYQAFIWEGYGQLDLTDVAGHGHVNGIIYNGVVYDEGNDQVFGPTVVNENKRIDESVSTPRMIDDFTCGRTSTIAYNPTEDFEYFSDVTNALMITEGAPMNYESCYEPVEYSIETNAIGVPSNWNFGLFVNLTASTPTASIVLAVEDMDYEKLNVYYSGNKPLNQTTQTEAAMTKLTEQELAQTGYWLTGVTGIDASQAYYIQIPLNNPTNSGNAKIQDGTILLESITRDSIIYSPTDQFLGYLSSRNFVRNNMKYNYYCPNGVKYSYLYYQNDSTLGVVIKKLYILIPFADEEMRMNFGIPLQEVEVTFDGNTYKLVDDYGYSFEYRSGNLMVELADTMDDGSVDEYSRINDDFTRAVVTKGGSSHSAFNATVKIISSGFGDSKDGYNNTMQESEIIYTSNFRFTISDPSEN